MIKTGRTTEGAAAAASHTGSLAGSDEVYDAIFAQAGVIRVESVGELFDCAEVFIDPVLPEGRGTAIVTNAGRAGHHGDRRLHPLRPEDFRGSRNTRSSRCVSSCRRPPTSRTRWTSSEMPSTIAIARPWMR